MPDNESIVKNFQKLYDMVLNLRKDDDYGVNQEQMDKLMALYRFFVDLADISCDEVEKPQLSPKEIHGGVTARFLVFDIYGDKVQQFCTVLSACSAVSIDAELNGKICISCTVPDVFIRKQ